MRFVLASACRVRAAVRPWALTSCAARERHRRGVATPVREVLSERLRARRGSASCWPSSGCFSLPLLLGAGRWGGVRGLRACSAARRAAATADVMPSDWPCGCCACRLDGAAARHALSAGDSTGYLASGVQLARHGTLVMHDPTLAHLSVDLEARVVSERGPGARCDHRTCGSSGSFILRSLDSDEVLPAFHHLITRVDCRRRFAGGD